MSKWPGCPVVACKNDLCHEECQALKMQVTTRKDPIIPTVEAIESMQRNVYYWGDRCDRAEAKLRKIAEHPDTPELIRQYAAGMLDGLMTAQDDVQTSPSRDPAA